jgi:hypothetical protein
MVPPPPRLAWIAILLAGLPACSSRASKGEPPHASSSASSARIVEAPRYEPVREVPWIEAEMALRDKRPIAAIPSRDRRVHLTLPDGCWTTTAPTDSALPVVLSEVDPNHEEIGTTEWFRDYEEIPFSQATSLLRDGKVYAVSDNDRGRLLFEVFDPERKQYLTYAPPSVHVATLLQSNRNRNFSIQHRRTREIRWREAQDILRTFPAGVGTSHGGFVYIPDPTGGPTRVTYDPDPNEHTLSRFLREIDPEGKMGITTE